tara:strand:+ start:5447 stop:5791 length:345 start_codon:yes stop_codon:yes gene_type:complete
MPGKQKKKGSNLLRPLNELIDRLSGKYGTRAEEEAFGKDIESDPFFKRVFDLERGELQATTRKAAKKKTATKKLPTSKKAKALDDIRKRRKELIKKGQREAIKEATDSFFKDVD